VPQPTDTHAIYQVPFVQRFDKIKESRSMRWVEHIARPREM
jgi:hypothetical protein